MEHRHQRAAFAPRIRDVARLYPRIYLAHCYLCDGRGRCDLVVNGRVIERACANCSGRGSIVSEAA